MSTNSDKNYKWDKMKYYENGGKLQIEKRNMTCVGRKKKDLNVKTTGIQQLSWTTISRMDKWEIPNLQIICYLKPSILAVAYLVTRLD